MKFSFFYDLKGAVLLVFVSLVLALGVNAYSPCGIPFKGQWNPEKGSVMPDPSKFAQAEEITDPIKLRSMIKSGSLVLIDARPGFLYDQGHLPHALSFPLSDFDKNLARLKWRLTPGLSVVVYCSGVDCMDSHHFAEKLTAMGISPVMVYSGGFAEWEQMGFEVVTNG